MKNEGIVEAMKAHSFLRQGDAQPYCKCGHGNLAAMFAFVVAQVGTSS